MNKQSNLYTVVYIIVVVVLVGAALAFTAMSLRDRQQANANADKMKQILAAVHIPTDGADVKALYDSHITGLLLVDSEGKILKEGDNADKEIFDIKVADQSKEKDVAKRLLPVYLCRLDNGAEKYILPVAGSGLWGPIWGYVAIDADGSTIYGAYFSHEGETPGLGAEIANPEWQKKFDNKVIFKGNSFLPITVVKAGQKPLDDRDYVDGISGGTITSKGVGEMLDNCLKPYEAYLASIRNAKNN